MAGGRFSKPVFCHYSRFVLFFVSLLVSSLAHAEMAKEDYQKLSASTKQELLWQQIEASEWPTLPQMTFLDPNRGTVKQTHEFVRAAGSLGTSFDHVSDEIPEGRPKIIHGYGSVAQILFIADELHPFTGLFQTGATGLARLSLALPHANAGNFVPGLALKLMVDGSRSRNLHVMERLEGQGPDRNYFSKTFTNVLPEPEGTGPKIGRWWFERFVENAIHLTVDHVAAVTQSGETIATPNAPHQLFFRPVEGTFTDSTSEDFRLDLEAFAVGTPLYEVYGSEASEDGGKLWYIGRIVTTSRFVASEYGDRVLFFQHEGGTRRTFWTGRTIPSAPAPQ